MGFEMKMKEDSVGMHTLMRPCGSSIIGYQPWAWSVKGNRPYLALGFEASKGPVLAYDFLFRDRCRSGLSGTPGKRVLVKANRGFESLPVRTNVRTGSLTTRRGRVAGAGAGLRGRIARARSAQAHQPGGVAAKIVRQAGAKAGARRIKKVGRPR